MPSCSICVEDLQKPTCCIPCGHVFCCGCINDWKQQKKAHEEWCCPQCRKRIIDTQFLFIDQEDDVLKYKDKCGFLQEKIDELAEQLAVLQLTNEQLNTEISTRNKIEHAKLQDKIDDITHLVSILQKTNTSLEVRLKYEKDNNSKLSLEVSNLEHEVFTLKEKEALVQLDDGKQHKDLSTDLSTVDSDIIIAELMKRIKGYDIYVNLVIWIGFFVLLAYLIYLHQQRSATIMWNRLDIFTLSVVGIFIILVSCFQDEEKHVEIILVEMNRCDKVKKKILRQKQKNNKYRHKKIYINM